MFLQRDTTDKNWALEWMIVLGVSSWGRTWTWNSNDRLASQGRHRKNHVVFLLDSKCPLNVSSREYINEQIKRKFEKERRLLSVGKSFAAKGFAITEHMFYFSINMWRIPLTPSARPLRNDSFKISFGERRKFSLSHKKHRKIHSKSWKFSSLSLQPPKKCMLSGAKLRRSRCSSLLLREVPFYRGWWRKSMKRTFGELSAFSLAAFESDESSEWFNQKQSLLPKTEPPNASSEGYAQLFSRFSRFHFSPAFSNILCFVRFLYFGIWRRSTSTRIFFFPASGSR